MATEQAFLIPLTTIPQTFQINLGGIQYSMTVRWNVTEYDGNGSWFVAFADATTGVEIIDNMPLVTGIDLLDGLEYLGFNGSLIVYTDGDATAVPDFTDLGVQSNLYFLTSTGT